MLEEKHAFLPLKISWTQAVHYEDDCQKDISTERNVGKRRQVDLIL